MQWRRWTAESDVSEERADQLRALEHVIETCRRRADDCGMPGLAHLLRRAVLSLSDHAARDVPALPRGPALSMPRPRIARH